MCAVFAAGAGAAAGTGAAAGGGVAGAGAAAAAGVAAAAATAAAAAAAAGGGGGASAAAAAAAVAAADGASAGAGAGLVAVPVASTAAAAAAVVCYAAAAAAAAAAVLLLLLLLPLESDKESSVYSHDGSEIVANYNDDTVYLFDRRRSLTALRILYCSVNSLPRNEYHEASSYKGHMNDRTIKVQAGPDVVRMIVDRVSILWERIANTSFLDMSACLSSFLSACRTFGQIYFVLAVQKGDPDVVNCLEPHPHLPVRFHPAPLSSNHMAAPDSLMHPAL
eukprot:747501-Hanusia_phi.AAC.1